MEKSGCEMMTDNAVLKNNSIIHFSALRLRAGTWLKLSHFLGEEPAYDVEFVAAIHGKSIFVSQPDAPSGGIRVGDQYAIYGFNGTSEFTFAAEILQLQDGPFFYAQLTYPDAVEVRVVRDALRVNVSIPVLVMPDGSSSHVSGAIKDLSVKGAMVESAIPAGRVGDKVSLVFSTEIDARGKVDLDIPARIIYVRKPDAEGVFRSGLEFGHIARDDELILYYLLFTHYAKITNEVGAAIMQLKKNATP